MIIHSVHMVIDGYLNSQWKRTVYIAVFYFCGIDREYLLIILVYNNLTQQRLFNKKLIKVSFLLVLWSTRTEVWKQVREYSWIFSFHTREIRSNYFSSTQKGLHVNRPGCRGPAPADPGYSKRGRRRRLIYL